MSRQNASPKKSSGTVKRVLWILVIGAVAAAAVSTATTRTVRTPAPPPAPEPMARMTARALQSHASDNAIIAGAGAGNKALSVNAERNGITIELPPAPEPPAIPGKPKPAIRLVKVRSESPHSSKDKAMADALVVAQLKLGEQLRALEPPIEQMPTLEQIKADFVRPDTVSEIPPTQELKDEWAAAKAEPNRVWVEFDVEVSDDQVRQLRGGLRLQEAGLVAALGFIVVAGIFGFLRLDSWTKGYLSLGLGAIFVIVVAAAVFTVVSLR